MATANRNIDIVDLIPAQIAGVMFLIQFGIVELVAYDGAFDLHDTYEIVGGYDISLAFLINLGAFALIIFTNSIGGDDLRFWDDEDGLEQVYGLAIVGTLAMIISVEFFDSIGDFVTTSDIAGTAAFLVSVVAIWAIVWIR